MNGKDTKKYKIYKGSKEEERINLITLVITILFLNIYF